MASQIRFDPPKVDGLVAAGTTIAAAAERLGVPIELACHGVGECTSCAVEVLDNPFGLSEVTEAERRMLGEERLNNSIRLACQARVHEGDCTLRVLVEPKGAAEPGGERREEQTEGAPERAREHILEAFSALPAAEQLSTALELQMKVAGDLLGAIVETPLRVGEQIIDSIFGPPAAPDGELTGGEDEQGDTTRKEDGPDASASDEGRGTNG